MNIDNVLVAAAVGGVVVALLGILVSLKSIRDQLWVVTFSEYTRRYLDIVKEMPAELRSPTSPESLKDLSMEERVRLLSAVRSYVNLCSEEFYLQRRGVLDKGTWRIWTMGIRDMLRQPWFAEAWYLIKSEYNFYGDFCSFFEELMPMAAVDSR